MNCRECQDRIQRFLDGDAAADGPEVRAHREGCAACRQEWAAARRLLEGLGQLPRSRPPVLLAPKVVAAALLDRQVRRRRLVYRWYATATLAASLLLFVGIGNLVSIWRGG